MIRVSIVCAFMLSFISFAFLPQIPDELGNNVSFKNGSWVKYFIKDNEENTNTELYIAILGDTKVSDKNGHWIEVMAKNDEGSVIAKYIVVDGLRDMVSGKMVLKFDNRPPYSIEFLIPDDTLKSEENRIKPEMKFIANTNIETPTGEINTNHYKVFEKDSLLCELWTSKEIPIFGIVKSQTQMELIELQEYGETGAKDFITETPIEMNLGQFMLEIMKENMNDEDSGKY